MEGGDAAGLKSLWYLFLCASGTLYRQPEILVVAEGLVGEGLCSLQYCELLSF